jgi:very-short-patch-repair endonuclease
LAKREPVPNVVSGSRTNVEKLIRARELRQTMTRPERLLWRALKANRFEYLHFRRQQVIDGYIVDFYCHAASLIVEVDGSVHQERREDDANRDIALTAHGLRVLRVRNGEVLNDIDTVLERIWSAAHDDDLTSTFPFLLGRGIGDR